MRVTRWDVEEGTGELTDTRRMDAAQRGAIWSLGVELSVEGQKMTPGHSKSRMD